LSASARSSGIQRVNRRLATLFIHSLPEFLSRNYRGWVLLVLCNALLDFLAQPRGKREILLRGGDVIPKDFYNVKLFREW
jgi:hypothetical protein